MPTSDAVRAQRASTIDANDQLKTAAEYQNLVVAWKNGNPLRLKDVAVIVDDAENLRLAAWSDTTAGVILNVQRQPGANVIQTVDRVKALLPKLQASLPASIDVQVIADRTTTIRAMLINIPARAAFSALTYTMHLPVNSRREAVFMTMFDAIQAPPQAT